MAHNFARISVRPNTWALVPWGGSGGDLEGLLLAGLNVVAIDIDSEMINAMTRRIAAIQGRVKEGKEVMKTCTKYYSIGVTNDEDDEDDDEEEKQEEEAGGEK